jgi:hypothetical protein
VSISTTNKTPETASHIQKGILGYSS